MELLISRQNIVVQYVTSKLQRSSSDCRAVGPVSGMKYYVLYGVRMYEYGRTE